MTAEVHTLARAAGDRGPPLVPAKVVFREEGVYLRSDPALLDSSWYRRCSAAEFRAANALRHRALKQQPAGSLPDDESDLAFLSDNGLNVAAWKRVRNRALEGWVLCSDGRWHHPDIARNVLHIWIGRLESRRIGAWGNVSRAKDGGLYGLDSILEDLDEALDALRALDAQDIVLRKASEQQSKWMIRLEQVRSGSLWQAEEPSDGAEPNRSPNRQPNRMPIRTPPGGSPKVSLGEPRLEESSSPLRGDDSSDRPDESGWELGLEGGSAERTAPDAAKRERAPPWPPDRFEVFQARYPKREAWGRAEKVLERVRRAGKVPFEEIMAGVDRLVARIASGQLQLQFVPQPAKWLDGRGWEDEVDPPGAVTVLARAGPPSRTSPGSSITMRAAQRAAERLGLHGEPRPDV